MTTTTTITETTVTETTTETITKSKFSAEVISLYFSEEISVVEALSSVAGKYDIEPEDVKSLCNKKLFDMLNADSQNRFLIEKKPRPSWKKPIKLRKEIAPNHK